MRLVTRKLKASTRKDIAVEMIQSFTNTFFRKTGFIATVTVEEIVDFKAQKNPLFIYSLEQLEEFFKKAFPHMFIEGKPNPIHVNSRRREYIDVRCVFSYIAHSFGFSYTQIGKYENNKNHTTIIHHMNKVKDLLEAKDHEMTELYTIIINELNNAYATSISGDIRDESNP